jgi:hypothetical protein
MIPFKETFPRLRNSWRNGADIKMEGMRKQGDTVTGRNQKPSGIGEIGGRWAGFFKLKPGAMEERVSSTTSVISREQ